VGRGSQLGPSLRRLANSWYKASRSDCYVRLVNLDTSTGCSKIGLSVSRSCGGGASRPAGGRTGCTSLPDFVDGCARIGRAASSATGRTSCQPRQHGQRRERTPCPPPGKKARRTSLSMSNAESLGFMALRAKRLAAKQEERDKADQAKARSRKQEAGTS
jgi:hypothetical protein